MQPVFSSVEAMQKWDPTARPIPVEALRAALAASAEDTDLIVLDPTADTEFVIRRPAVWAIAQEHAWEPSFLSTEVYTALQESVAHELAVIDVAVASGDPDARLRGPELIVVLELVDGLEREVLDAVLSRLAQRWASDDRIAVLADSLTVKLPPQRLSALRYDRGMSRGLLRAIAVVALLGGAVTGSSGCALACPRDRMDERRHTRDQRRSGGGGGPVLRRGGVLAGAGYRADLIDQPVHRDASG